MAQFNNRREALSAITKQMQRVGYYDGSSMIKGLQVEDEEHFQDTAIANRDMHSQAEVCHLYFDNGVASVTWMRKILFA